MHYKHTQLGRTILIIMGSITALLIFSLYSKPDASIWFAFVLVGLIGLLFSTLTIKVEGTKIHWFFGPRFWKKSLELANVASVRQIKTKWYYGFGIRLISTGWLYNVSGLTAVELKLNDGTTVSLGTDDPDNLMNAINKIK